MRASRFPTAAAVIAALAAAAAFGCNLIADIEAGEPLDEVVPDASTDASTDAPESAPPKCTGATCSIGGKKSLCHGGTCDPCRDRADDKACAAAYPAAAGPSSICDEGACRTGTCTSDAQCTGFPEVCSGGRCVLCAADADCGSGRLCVAGICADGDCRTNDDCGGKLCVAYRCMPCTSDRACARLNPGAPICDHGKGTCRAAACTTGDKTFPNHVCCADTVWHFGDCCDSGSCLTAGKTTCADHVCASTACAAPVDDASNKLTYVVDPATAVDNGTGTPACPMKSLTAALRVAPVRSQVIFAVASLATLGAAEAWPLYLDALLTVTSGPTILTFNVPSNAVAGLVLTGGEAFAQGASMHGGGGRMGIVAASGMSKAWFVDAIGFTDGFVVAPDATLVLDKASVANDNSRYGALVWGFFDVHELGSDGHRYMKNGSAAIAIFGMGYAHLTGSFMSPVFVEQNGGDGVLLWPLPASANPTTIDTLSMKGNRNGLVVAGGAHVTVRKTIFEANKASGVLVRPYRSSAGPSDDLTGINLGTDPLPPMTANNTLQGPAGLKNGGAGICLASSPNAGTLNAKGNVFGGADCADGGVLSTSTTCDGGVDIAVTSTGNKIAVDLCTAP